MNGKEPILYSNEPVAQEACAFYFILQSPKEEQLVLTFTQVGRFEAPIEKVFAVVSDFSKIPQWRKDVPAITQISSPTDLGAAFLEEVHFMGKNNC